MQEYQIPKVESHKHLGLYLSNDCSWHKHIAYITEWAWYRINILRKLKFRWDRKSLETIYITFIRPLLEYGDIIWDNGTHQEKTELDKVQNEAARIAAGTTKRVSMDALYKETSWETLKQRRNNHKLSLFYKMMNSLAPTYLTSLVPQPVSNLSRFNLRNFNDLQFTNARTNQYYNSFLPSTVRAWNNLPVEIKQSASVQCFKNSLKLVGWLVVLGLTALYFSLYRAVSQREGEREKKG